MLSLVAACVLAFEVSLTRVCSVLLKYHISFAVVSLAILGLGLGGFAGHVMSRGQRDGSFGLASAAVLALSPGMLLALATLLVLPFASNWPTLLFLLLPAFIATGVFQSLLLRAFSEHAGALYAADLIGAAAGALASVLLIDRLGGPVNTVLLLAIIAAGGAWLWTRERRPPGASSTAAMRVATILLAASIGIASLQSFTGFLDVNYERTPEKLIHQAIQPTPVGTPRLVPELRRWDAYSRIDVVDLDTPRGVQRLVFIDGETPTAMLTPQSRAPGSGGLDIRDALPALPYRVLDPQSVLSIGSGSGFDVMVARRFGVQRIDAVELNAGVLEVTELARSFTGDVYGQEGVRSVHSEGRLFVRRAPPASYDLVILVLAQSIAGNLREYALSENYLYTREAFQDYLRVLREDGALLLLVNNEALVLKLARTALEVLDERGVSAPDCIAALSSAREHPYDHLLLVRSSPFDRSELDALVAEVARRPYTPLHLPPGAGAEVPQLTRSALGSGSLLLDPATDDRPFFFHVHPAIPQGVLILLLIGALLLLVGGTATAWAARDRGDSSPGPAFAHAGYFVLLGLAFMMVEVLVLQKTILFIGYPTLNLAVILAVFLVAAGSGSAASRHLLRRRARRRLRVVLVALGGGLLAVIPILDALQAPLDSLPLPTRCLLLALVLFPFAFLMGIPFPAGIRLLPPRATRLVPWLWGLNGVASIVGSGLVVAIALDAGFRSTSFLPATLYIVAALFTFGLEAECGGLDA